jgi:hypothetical protein
MNNQTSKQKLNRHNFLKFLKILAIYILCFISSFITNILIFLPYTKNGEFKLFDFFDGKFGFLNDILFYLFTFVVAPFSILIIYNLFVLPGSYTSNRLFNRKENTPE